MELRVCMSAPHVSDDYLFSLLISNNLDGSSSGAGFGCSNGKHKNTKWYALVPQVYHFLWFLCSIEPSYFYEKEGVTSRELLRKLQAAKYVREHGGEVCPASWEPGKDTLHPGLDLVGKI